MKCFDINGPKVTPYINAGRLSFLRIGNSRVPLHKSFIDALPWFGRISLKDVELSETGHSAGNHRGTQLGQYIDSTNLPVTTPGYSNKTESPVTIRPGSSAGAVGDEEVLVKLAQGVHSTSKLKVVSNCRIILAERFLDSKVFGSPGPTPPVMVTFHSFEALLTFKKGEKLVLTETYETVEPVGFFEALRGKRGRVVEVTRTVTISYDGEMRVHCSD